jgi:hypothetical protein
VTTPVVRKCSYCGADTYARVACRCHQDLLNVDPHYLAGRVTSRPPGRERAGDAPGAAAGRVRGPRTIVDRLLEA